MTRHCGYFRFLRHPRASDSRCRAGSPHGARIDARQRPIDRDAMRFSAGMMRLGAGARGRAWMSDGFVALYIFMLAAIAGHVIISRVPVILHTPLMSGSNFIHGIVLIGAMIVLGHADTTLEKIIGFIAVLLGTGNAAGGYVVTERMLDMFKTSRKPGGKGDKA
jgi:NAD(P) transhydrogenase subunit alpha